MKSANSSRSSITNVNVLAEMQLNSANLIKLATQTLLYIMRVVFRLTYNSIRRTCSRPSRTLSIYM